MPEWLDDVGSIPGNVVNGVKNFVTGGPTQLVVGAVTTGAKAALSLVADGDAGASGGGGIAGFGGAGSLNADYFDGMSHEEIVASVEQMEPGVVDASSAGWKAISTTLSEGLTDFNKAIEGQIHGDGAPGWTGDAADAALKAANGYVGESEQLSTAGQDMARTVQDAADSINRVKTLMPPPVHVNLAETVLSKIGIKSALHERDEAHQQAIQIMKAVYSPAMQDAYDGVPELPKPRKVVGPEQPPGGGGSSGGGGGGGGGGAGTSPTGGTEPTGGTDQPNADTPGATPAGGDGVAPEVTGQQAGGAGNAATSGGWPGGQQSDSQVRAAGVGPNGAGPGYAGAGSGGFGGGYGGGSSGYGGGAGGFGAGTGSGAGGYGGSGFVPTPGATPIAAGAAGAAGAPGASIGAAGRPGTPGAGMSGAGARGAGGDDDAEHNTPGYLVNVDNGNELVGTIPLVAPPVLGA